MRERVPVIRSVLLVLATMAASASADEVILGQTLDLSGPAGNIGQALKRGREACLERANQRAQPGSRPLRLVTLDDRGDPLAAQANVQRLVETERAIGLLGPMGAAVDAAVLPWAARRRVAVIGPFGGDVESRVKEWNTTFSLTANQSGEAQRLASHVRSLGLSRVVILYSADAAGRAALTAFEEAMGVVEIPPVKVVDLGRTARAASAAVAEVRAEGADAVMLATTGEQTARALRAFHAAGRAGSPLQIYGMSSAASLADIQALGDVAVGFSMSVVLPSPREVQLPVISAFRQAVGGRDMDGSYVELEGCITSMVVAEVLQRKGARPTSVGLLSALQAAGIVNLGGFQVDLADRSGATRFTDIVFIKGGGRVVR